MRQAHYQHYLLRTLTLTRNGFSIAPLQFVSHRHPPRQPPQHHCDSQSAPEVAGCLSNFVAVALRFCRRRAGLHRRHHTTIVPVWSEMRVQRVYCSPSMSLDHCELDRQLAGATFAMTKIRLARRPTTLNLRELHDTCYAEHGGTAVSGCRFEYVYTGFNWCQSENNSYSLLAWKTRTVANACLNNETALV